jgi:ABC-type branched-subunit amino acid transport system substrate-binding protein
VVAVATVACGSGGGDTPTAAPSNGALAATAGPGVTEDTIRLGMTNDMGGAGKTPYGAVTRAMSSYFAWLNEQGGVCGRSIELLVEDDQYSGEKALAGTKKLVEQDRVLAMVGAVGTEAHQAVGPYLNDPNADGNTDDGVPDLFVSTGWSGWHDVTRYPWTVGFIPGFLTDGAVLGLYANEAFEGKKVGVLHRDDDFGKEYAAGVAVALGGADKIVSQSYVSEEVDVAVQVGQLKDAGVEVLVLATTPEVVSTAMRAAAALGWAPQVMTGYTSPPSTMAARIGGGTSTAELEVGFQALDGMISTEYLLSPIEDESNDVIQEHRRVMQTYQGPQVSTLTVYGQAVAETTVDALGRSCENLNRAGLMAAVESMNDFRPTVMLPDIRVSLSDTDHKGIESLQPVEITFTGEVHRMGKVIGLESTSADEG